MFFIIVSLMLTACTGSSSENGETDEETHALSDAPSPSDSGEDDTPAVFTVIIDPGHGFDDPGSSPRFLGCNEADVTVKAAEKLQRALRDAGIESVMTHNGSTFPSVDEITYFADKGKVDYDTEKMKNNNTFSAYERVIYANAVAKQNKGNCFFVSLHTNSVEDAPYVKGLAIDYFKNSPHSAALAGFCRSFEDSVRNVLQKDTVIFEDEEEDAYIVNKYCTAPSVLIEMGYGSNSVDGADLTSDAWLDKFCAMLADVISDNTDILSTAAVK